MTKFAQGLFPRAGAIVDAAAEFCDIDDAGAALHELVQQAIERIDSGTPIDIGPLKARGWDDRQISYVLRALLFGGFEAVRPHMDETAFSELALAWRHCVLDKVPRPPVKADDAKFYGLLLDGVSEGLEPAHARLFDLLVDLCATSRNIVYAHDLSGSILFVNPPGLQLTRYAADDVKKGISVYDLIAPEYLDLIEARMEAPGAVSRVPYGVEIYSKDGERIPVELTTHVLRREGRMAGVIGIARDLRLARRLEGEIRRSNAFIDAVVANVPVGIILADTQTVSTEVNPAAAALLGAPNTAALVGVPVHTVFGEGGAILRERLCEAIAYEREVQFELETTTGFGAKLTCDLTVLPLKQSRTCIDSVLVLMTDVARMKSLQDGLAQSDRLNVLGGIVAGVAHELNNPVTGILGYAQLLLTTDLDPLTRSRINHMVIEAERCRHIVQNLLTFSARYAANHSPQDINTILNDTVSLLSYQLRVDQIAVDMNLAPDLPPVTADPSDLQRVFLNLINNAHQALMSIEKTDKRLDVRTQRMGDTILATIADNGPGVPEDIKSRVFDPFFTTRGVGGGPGLGLSTVYGIVNKQGGRVLLESEEGKGAAFTIVLPVTPEAPAS